MTPPDKLTSALDKITCILADIAYSQDLDLKGAKNLAAHAYKELKKIAPLISSKQ